MAYTLNPGILQSAFAAGRIIDGGKPVAFDVVEAGTLHLTSGHVVAADPLVFPEQSPFIQTVPSGSHPITLAIARFENGDERIAYARLRFGDSPPVRWQMALTENQDAASLKDDEFFGYGVDAGLGCFMDAVAGELLNERMSSETEYYEQIIEGLDTTYKPTRSWFSFCPSSGHSENVVCFSSGWGDGMYPSFFGYSADDAIVALVTDFCILLGEEAPQESEPQRKPWWKVW